MEARGDICPRAQRFGDAKLRWECYVTITKCQISTDAIKENVECQRLLLSCEISSRSQWLPKRIFMNPGDVKVELLSPAISANMWFD